MHRAPSGNVRCAPDPPAGATVPGFRRGWPDAARAGPLRHRGRHRRAAPQSEVKPEKNPPLRFLDRRGGGSFWLNARRRTASRLRSSIWSSRGRALESWSSRAPEAAVGKPASRRSGSTSSRLRYSSSSATPVSRRNSARPTSRPMCFSSRTKVVKLPPMVRFRFSRIRRLRHDRAESCSPPAGTGSPPRSADDARASGLGQRPIALIEPELLVRVADEIKRRQARLAVGLPKAAPELLEKHRRALCGPEEEHVSISGTSTPSLNRSTAKTARSRHASRRLRSASSRSSPWCSGRHRRRRQADPVELPRHELGVRDAHAEPERSHAARVGDLVLNRLGDERGARVIRRCRGSRAQRTS